MLEFVAVLTQINARPDIFTMVSFVLEPVEAAGIVRVVRALTLARQFEEERHPTKG
jgi:hypothetical protein